jgi:competence protein ComEA
LNFKKLARKFGFTENEFKTVLFLLSAAFVGLFLTYLGYEEPSPDKFNYRKDDSLFSSYPIPASKKTKAEADSQKETLDFNDHKSNLNIKFVTRQILINVNSATEAELCSLPGIGKKTAQAIIAYRKKHGNFTSKNDLIKVKGIGKSKLEKIKKLIKIN